MKLQQSIHAMPRSLWIGGLVLLCLVLFNGQGGAMVLTDEMKMPLPERLDQARARVQQGAVGDELTRALADVVRFTGEEERPATIAVLTDLAAQAPEGSPQWQALLLAKGTLLLYAGIKSEGHDLFEIALTAGWPGAYEAYTQALRDTNQWEEALWMEYQRCIGAAPFMAYRTAETSMLDFCNAMFQFKARRLPYSCVETIGTVLEASSAYPSAQPLGLIFCLAADREWDMALTRLAELETTLQSNPADPEYNNLPLYRLLIQNRRGDAFEVLRPLFDQVVERQGGDFVAASRLMFRTYPIFVNTDGEGMRRLDEWVYCVVLDPRMQSLSVQAQFHPEELACLYNHLQSGLAWSGNWDGAKQTCLLAMGSYFPGTMNGTEMAKNFVRYLEWDNQEIEAFILAEQILQHYPYDPVVPSTEFYLAQPLLRGQRHAEAEVLLQDCLRRIGPTTDFHAQIRYAAAQRQLQGLQRFKQREMAP